MASLLTAEHVDRLLEAGHTKVAQRINAVCGKLMLLADSAFGECIDQECAQGTVLPAIGGEEGDNRVLVDSYGKLTAAAQIEITQRYEAMSLALARKGEERAAALEHENAMIKRNAVTEILGRTPVGERCVLGGCMRMLRL